MSEEEVGRIDLVIREYTFNKKEDILNICHDGAGKSNDEEMIAKLYWSEKFTKKGDRI